MQHWQPEGQGRVLKNHVPVGSPTLPLDDKHTFKQVRAAANYRVSTVDVLSDGRFTSSGDKQNSPRSILVQLVEHQVLHAQGGKRRQNLNNEVHRSGFAARAWPR